MIFTNPLILAGVGAAAVPLVLHLLSRSRYRTVDWGAMMFLVAADSRQQQRSRLRQWLLLLIRMLIIALLAVALARPVIEGRWAMFTPQARTTAVIVFDQSASMGLEESGKSRLELARDAAMTILMHCGSGDQVALMPVGQAAGSLDVTPTSDLQQVARTIAELSPSAGRAKLSEAITAAMTTLAKYPKDIRALYLITDRQAVSFEGIDDDFAAAIAAQVLPADAANSIRAMIVPVGTHESENVSVDALTLISPPAVKGQPGEIEVSLANHGDTARPAVPLVVRRTNPDEILLETTINLPPHTMRTLRLNPRFDQAGPQLLNASIRAGGLLSDDSLDAVIDVLPPLDVLVVSGDQRKGRFKSESDFLSLALAPFSNLKRSGPDLAKVTVVEPPKLPTVDLAEFDVVVLANVPQLPVPMVRTLEQYIYDGGGVLVAPGNLTRVDAYNELLYRDGGGALPAPLSPATAIDGAAATRLIGLDLSHPVLQFLRGLPDPIPPATIARYFPVVVPDSRTRILGTYGGGEPFLLESTFGRGRVLMLTTPLDADWNTLPLTNFYLPFVQSAVRWLAGATLNNRNLTLGSEMVLTVPEPVDIARSSLQPPDGKRQPLTGTHLGGRAEMRGGIAATAGTYQFRIKGGEKDRLFPFVIRGDAAESDLTPLADQKLLKLAQDLNFELTDPAQKPLAAVLDQSASRQELWPMLLGAVFVLILIELLLVRTLTVAAGEAPWRPWSKPAAT